MKKRQEYLAYKVNTVRLDLLIEINKEEIDRGSQRGSSD